MSGDGVARHRRRRLLVPFTIPGERVRVKPGTARGDAFPATLVEILQASPHRVTAPCPHFGPPSTQRETGPAPREGGCGGCSWQHIAYPEQLRLKSELVTRLVQEAVPKAPAAAMTLAGTPIDDPWRYRHKVHFVFGNTSSTPRRLGALTMGHYARGSRRVIPVRVCPVHDSRGNEIAFAFRDAYAVSPSSTLKSIAVRVSASMPEAMGTLVVTDESDKSVRAASKRVLQGDAAPTAFHLNIHPRDDGFIFGRDTKRISGPERMREQVGGASFLISPTSFFQTNVRAAEILVQLVLKAVPKGARVLDLYAGAGLFAIPLAKGGREVVAVEENRAAVTDGEVSFRLNRLPADRCRFLTRPVEEVLRRPEGLRFGTDAVVLDPPREGCERVVLDAVFGSIRPRTGVYVSCNPEALARDLAIIVGHGYRIESLQPVDMFPHTAHIETVAVLSR